MERQSTLVIKVDPRSIDESALSPAADLLNKDQLVAFPTETVYGLGANALSRAACQRIFAAKGRPSDNPLIVHVSSVDMLSPLVDGGVTPEALLPLIDAFWPGPLTLLFPKSTAVPDVVTAGQRTIAVRMPSHPIARALIALAGCPIAAPSANRSGRPSPTSARHVLEDLQGRIACVVDGGPTSVGVESTVLDALRSPPTILRPGGVTLEQLQPLIPRVCYYALHSDDALEAKPPTPGLKYTHYSPSAKVVLVEQGTHDGSHTHTDSVNVDDEDVSLVDCTGVVHSNQRVHQAIAQAIAHAVDRGMSTGYIHTPGVEALPDEYAKCVEVYPISADGEEEVEKKTVEERDERRAAAMANKLFDALRTLDHRGVRIIVVAGVLERGIGVAVMNRLRKAADLTIWCSASSPHHL